MDLMQSLWLVGVYYLHIGGGKGGYGQIKLDDNAVQRTLNLVLQPKPTSLPWDRAPCTHMQAGTVSTKP